MAPKWLALYGPLVARYAGNDVPLAMLLGHIQLESGGRPNDRTKLDERGLMQIHPATSRDMGFDHDRMFDPAYSIWAGVEMFKRMAAKLQRDYPTLFPTRNEFFWRVVRFEFSIGSGAVRKILGAMQTDRFVPRTWEPFTSYLEHNRQSLTRLTKHDPVRWAAFVDRVFTDGERLVEGVARIGGGALIIGLAAAALLLCMRRRKGRSDNDVS